MLHDDALLFRIPAGWSGDVTVLLTPDVARPGHAMTVTRERMGGGPGETVETHVDRMLVALAQQVEELEILARGTRPVAGCAAAWRHLRWASPSGPMEQAICGAEAEQHGRRFVYLFTGVAPAAEAPEMRARFEQLLSTIAHAGAPAPLPMHHVPMPGRRGEARR